jgi:hypothetical protein
MKLSQFSGFGVPCFVGPLVPRQLPEGCSIQCVGHIADQIARLSEASFNMSLAAWPELEVRLSEVAPGDGSLT